MCHGHGPGGLIGISLNGKAVYRWAMRLHNCSRLMKDMADLKNCSLVDITSPKEELASQIKVMKMTGTSLGKKLKLCIDPLNTDGQASAFVNIVYAQMR